DADIDLAFGEVRLQFVGVVDWDAADLLADELGVAVEGVDDDEALGVEAVIGEDGLAKVSDADENHRPLAVQAEDLAQFLGQTLDVIATPLLAEAPEVAEVLANLGRGDPED